MALPALLVNVGLSLGLELITNWLFPPPQKKIADDQPQLEKGQPLYFCWGETFAPAHLLYALTRSQSGTDEKHATYGAIGIANPQQTELLALRINGYIISTKSGNYPLTSPETLGLSGSAKGKGKGKKKTNRDPTLDDGTYVNQYGMTTYNDIGFTTQFGDKVYNNHFGILGYGDINYERLSWLAITGRRNVIGLPGARQVWYVINKNPVTTTIQINGSNNDPVIVHIVLFYNNSFIINNNVDVYFSSLHGFRGYQRITCFDGATFGSRSQSLLLIANGVEYVIKTDLQASVAFSMDIPTTLPTTTNGSDANTITGSNPLTTIGNFSRFILDISQANVNVLTNTVILGTEKGELFSYTLGSQKTAPFRSFNGVIYDSNNAYVDTVSPIMRVYGWNGRIYGNLVGDPFVPNNTPSRSITTSGINLSTIIRELVGYRQISPAKIIFKPGFEEVLHGFTCSTENVKDTILNLLTCYNKFVYRDREDNIVFCPYPSAPTATFIITPDLLTAEPKIEIVPQSALPECIELSYRNSAMQLSEDAMLIGNSASGGYKSSIRLNANLSSTEATKIGWNALNLIKHTYLKADIQIDKSGQVLEPGDVIDFQYFPDQTLRLLISSVEYGQDLSVKLTCVNYVGAQPLPAGILPTINVLPPISIPPLPDTHVYLNTEPQAANATLENGGSLFYTTSSSPYSTSGGIPATTTLRPSSAGTYEGILTSIFSAYGDDRQELGLIGVGILGNREGQNIANSGVIRIGKSWVSYNGVIRIGNSGFTMAKIKTGLFGSSSKLTLGDDVYVPGNNLIAPNTPTVFPSVSQANFTSLAPTYNLGFANATYGLPHVNFSINSGVLRAYFGSSGARASKVFGVQTEGVPDFDRIIKITNTITSATITVPLPAGQRYLELAMTINSIRGAVITLTETTSDGSVPTYGSWINSAIAT